MNSIEEQFEIVKKEWFDNLPDNKQTFERKMHMSASIREFYMGMQDKRKYAFIYTNEPWINELKEWIHLLYPDAVFIKNKYYYICLNFEQLADLKDRCMKDIRKIQRELNEYNDALEQINKHLF